MHVAQTQTSTAGAPGVFSAFSTAEGNFYQVALIRSKGLFGKTFSAAQPWMSVNIYEVRKAYKNLA